MKVYDSHCTYIHIFAFLRHYVWAIDVGNSVQQCVIIYLNIDMVFRVFTRHLVSEIHLLAIQSQQ